MAKLKDVAKLACVSSGTVSNVLSKRRKVSTFTERRVLQAIKKLNYQPNLVARSLRRGNITNLIALLVPDVSNPFYAEISKGCEDCAKKYGYALLLCNTIYNTGFIKTYIQILYQRQVDGIVFTSAPDEEYISEMGKIKLPFVVVDDAKDNTDFPVVKIDNINSTYKAVSYLIKRGRKRIGFISETSKMDTIKERFKGYKLALKENSIDYNPSIVSFGEENNIKEIQYGYNAMQNFLKNKLKIDAVFATNDLIAIGNLRAIKEFSLKVPDDIAVIGFDDIELASYVEPKLTTVHQPIYEIGFSAIELLIKIINKEKLKEKKIILGTELVIREST